MDGDSNPDLAVANSSISNNVSVLLGNGDGTFQAAVDYGVGYGPSSVAIGDLDGDSDLDLVTANSEDDDVSVLINTTTRILTADLTCVPSFGTVPFSTQMTVTLENLYSGQRRRIAAHIDIATASGSYFPNWRAGFMNIMEGGSTVTAWNTYLPALGTLIGDNRFDLVAEDITPAPYNQPPYPPAGDTATASCTVTGIAPR